MHPNRLPSFISLLLLLVLLPLQKGVSQALSKEDRSAIQAIVKNATTDYQELDASLMRHGPDSLFLAYFMRQSELHAYREGLSYAYNQLGIQQRGNSNFEQAIAYHTRALNQAQKAGNIEFQVVSLNLLGDTDLAIESIKSALDYYQEARGLAERVPNPGTGLQMQINMSLTGIGNIYRLLEQYDSAITYYEQSLEYDIRLGNARGQALNYQNIAECLEARGRLEPAMENYEKSLEANKTVGSDRIEIKNKYGMAHVLAHDERQEEAVQLLESVLPRAQQMGDVEMLSSVYIQKGWALSLLGRYAEARADLQKGLELSEEIQLFSNIYQGNTFLHDIAEAQGKYQEALAYYKTAQSARRKISNDRNRRYVAEIISRAETEKRLNEIEQLSKENQLVNMELRRNRTTQLVGGLLLALFILVLYILYRQYQLNSERKVHALEQSMLRSQMNPHFLFNSLNSIKLYIINNEQKNAVHYLNKFSKLVRKILEASSVREIPLEEELETVSLYMNIENIRFNDEIDFRISVDPEIDPTLVRIPSLILQPFLENALWHGLSSKEGPKQIHVEVSRSRPGFVDISIQDNGIGRAAAQALKDRRVLKRKSLGLEITKERMANFSKEYQNNYQLRMEDLFDEQGKPAGTKVTLQLPTV